MQTLGTAGDAYSQLRQQIITGELQPNERLVEADLIRSLGSTRTAVRTALQRLAHEGLVEHERNRGAKVRMVGEREAVEILEARTVLEGLVARKAAEKSTDADIERLQQVIAAMRERFEAGDLLGMSEVNTRLHAIILEIADHRTVERLVSTLNSQLVRFQYRTILVIGRPQHSFAEHSAIVAAIAGRDPDAAETAMRAHLEHLAEALRSVAVSGSPAAAR